MDAIWWAIGWIKVDSHGDCMIVVEQPIPVFLWSIILLKSLSLSVTRRYGGQISSHAGD
jgi:hypothetical protein